MNERLRRTAKRALGRGEVIRLEQRLAELEVEINEVRTQNLRLAEIVDVVQELLVPLASRDQSRVDAAIEKFEKSL